MLACWSSGPWLSLRLRRESFKPKQGSFAHSLSLFPTHHPDMTEDVKSASHPSIIYIKIIYVMDKALSGELSCMQTGPVGISSMRRCSNPFKTKAEN